MNRLLEKISTAKFYLRFKELWEQYQKLPRRFQALIYLGFIVLICILQPFIPIKLIRSMLAFLFQFMLLAPLLFVMYQQVHEWMKEFRFSRAEKKRLKTFGLATFILGLLFFILYCRAENDIKVYETATYWTKIIDERAQLSASIPRYLLSLRESLGQEYNDLAAFPLIFLSYFLGTSFTGYLLTIFFAYYAPACLLLTIFALRLTRPIRGKANPSATAFIICFYMFLLSADMLVPVLRGYMDVAGVVAVGMLLNLTLRWDGRDFDLKHCGALAAATATMLLVRRWYLFYVIFFYISYGGYFLIRMAREKRDEGAESVSSDSLKQFGKNLGVILGFCCGAFLLLNPRIFGVLVQGYSLAYSAYNDMNVLQNLWDIVKNNSIFITASGCVGFWMLLRNAKTRLMGVRLAVTALGATLAFCSIQNMYNQQRYMIIPTIVIFVCALVDFGVQYAYRTVKPLLAAGLCCICAINFLFAHVPMLKGHAAMARPFTTAMWGYPQENINAPVIRMVADDLIAAIGEDSTKVYVVGANEALSPELLRRSDLPNKSDATPFVVENSIVDLRDGFPHQLFLAEYVVVNDPYHASFEERQQVNYQVYDLLLNDPMSKEYYELQSTYRQNRENLLLFKRIKLADAKLVDNLRDRLEALYPDNPFIYQPDYFVALFEADPGTPYEYMLYWDKNIQMQKSYEKSLSAQWNTKGDFTVLEFTLSVWEDGMEVTVENQDGVIYRSPMEVAENVPHSIDITGSEFVRMHIDMVEGDEERVTNVILGHQQDGLR